MAGGGEVSSWSLQVAVAVKTLKSGSTVEEKVQILLLLPLLLLQVDFLSEADMMKRFEHRNIVRLLGVCTRNEPVYTVMEYMLYGDLKTYLLARRHLVNERNREELDEVSLHLTLLLSPSRCQTSGLPAWPWT